jgi:hypothetical protein
MDLVTAGAIMVIIFTTTGPTEPRGWDGTHVMVKPFATMSECQSNMSQTAANDGAKETEMLRERSRLIRSCTPIKGGTLNDYWYTWSDGRLDGDSVVMATPSVR